MKFFKKIKFKNLWYLLFILLIFTGQLIFTLNSTHKIRLEEIAESVRNVWWLQNRTIYDGISSNVGWYGTLLFIYNIFGFYLFEAKIYRLFIHLISLICIGKLLKKYLGEKKALLPLLAYGLSPTLLYFNSLQTSFGIDLQYFPICLYLLLTLDFSQPLSSCLKQFFVWFLVMVGAMSYPTFLAYLPVLGLIYLIVLLKNKKLPLNFFINNILFSVLAFCLPMILIFTYLKEPQLLIYDQHVKSGIFRGGGGGGQIPKNLSSLRANVIGGSKQVYRDLFIIPNSFYFEFDIVRAEFSHRLLGPAVLVILLISIWLGIKIKKASLPVGLSLLLIVTSLVVGNFSGSLPGIRRSAGVLAGFYCLYAVVWKYTSRKYLNKGIIVTISALSLLLISLHHLKVYPNNLAALLLSSPHAADGCYNLIPSNPVKSLNYFIAKVKNGDKINNFDYGQKDYVCRLHSLYAGAAGSCFWNHLDCPPLQAYDETKPGKHYIIISTKLWEKYYFNH